MQLPYVTTDPLADRIRARVHAEWPGTHIATRGLFQAPEIREGGATAALVELAIRIAVEEAAAPALAPEELVRVEAFGIHDE